MRRDSRRLFALFVALTSFLIVTTATLFWIGTLHIRINRARVAEEMYVAELTDVVLTLTEAETGQRGYLLTGDERYLAPYNAGLRRVADEVRRLRERAPAHEVSPADLDRLTALASQRLAALERTVALYRDGQPERALAEVKGGVGKQLMDDIRALVSKLNTAGDRRIAQLSAAADNRVLARTWAFIGVGGINLVAVAWAFGRIRREIGRRQAIAAEVVRQRELLAVTLASIGDAVIVTDVQSRITFMNRVAEALTGWTADAATGQPCAAVFNIVNEESRKPVESPVDKVLALGLVVGLANHTLLIRKDGTEIPIDDSGAPIRSGDGEVRGVVLVFRDFSEHKASQKALWDAKAELESAAQAKDRFLAMLSHELRTPLTPVLALLTAWEGDGRVPAGLGDDVRMMRRNVELEARLIDDLLDLTRIAKGKLSLNFEVADTRQLMGLVVEMFKPEVAQKRLDLVTRLDAARPFVRVDSARLQQVFWNVLKNAIKFTPDGGEIRIVSSNDAAGNLRVTVSDTGIGITPGSIGELFRPFQQGDPDVARRSGGLGLGLAISKALMDALGGTITAASEGRGRGSEFVVTLPSVDSPASALTFPAGPGETEATDGRRLSILLVEDHADTARAMSRLLRGLGHQVESCHSVAGALALLERRSFDLMLSDIGLPDGTGIDLMRRVRERHQFPAVALTGYGMDSDVAECRAAGFTTHLTKPITFQDLERVVRQATRDGVA